MNDRGAIQGVMGQPDGPHLTGAMLTDVGHVRAHNEDAVAYVSPEAGVAPYQDTLVLVADGMGGHAAGEVASRLASEVIRHSYFESPGPVHERLAFAFATANRTILEHATAHPECARMGTTCTAVAVRDGSLWLGHVGDSRAYLLREHKLIQLSQDQTVVAKLIRDGVMNEQEARTSEHANVLLQALGTSNDVVPELWSDGMPLRPGDIIVLCTDGLHGLVPDATIADTVAKLPPLEACEALIRGALDAGGHDNVSVGVFHAVNGRVAAQPAGNSTRRIWPLGGGPAEPDNDAIAATTRKISISESPS